MTIAGAKGSWASTVRVRIRRWVEPTACEASTYSVGLDRDDEAAHDSRAERATTRGDGQHALLQPGASAAARPSINVESPDECRVPRNEHGIPTSPPK